MYEQNKKFIPETIKSKQIQELNTRITEEFSRELQK